MKKLCIYHGNCVDGFGAAWAVRKALGEDNVDFHAGFFKNPPPNVFLRDVIIVDFSYKRDVLVSMAHDAERILILDHHKSAEKELVDLPDNVTAIFDMGRSGAVMAWEYFHPEIPTPKLLQHIEDRDLWRFNMQGTREVQAALFSYPYDFDVWDTLVKSTLKLERDGVALERKHFKDIHEFLEVATHRMRIAGYDVPAVNAPYFWSSDIGDILKEGEPFVACYWDEQDGIRQYSLRSAISGVDVSEIATLFGGGGHERAAGFSVPITYATMDPAG